MNRRILKLRTLLLSNKLYYILFFITLVFALTVSNFTVMTSRYTGNETEFTGIITSYTIDGNKLTFEFGAKEKLICSYYFETYDELINFKNSINLGDKLKLNGILQLPEQNSIPNTFNYKKYLYNNRMFYNLKVESFDVINKNSNLFYHIKNYILKRIDIIKHNEYVYAFILGETYYIDEEVNDTYRINGITHLFALSGSNVSLFAVLLGFILKKLKLSEFTSHIIIFLFLMLVNFITGFAPSMLRASIFFCFYGINKIFNFYIKTINILLLTFVTLVLCDLYIIYDLGFQFSFVITFFLILGNNLFKFKNFFTNLFLVSLIAFVASVPIVVYNFYYVNFMSIINNIFYVPYVSFVVFPCSIAVFIFPFLSDLFYYVTLLMEYISLSLNKISVFYISFPKISLITAIVYYIFFVLYMHYKRWIFVILLFLLLIVNYFIPYLDNSSYIYFFDVGQGDSALIITPNLKKSILIDTGGIVQYTQESWKQRNKNFSLIKQNLIPFFNSIGIKKIDYLFLTHGDTDHLGNAEELINNFRVKSIFINNGNINNLEKRLKNALIFDKSYIKINEVEIYSLNKKIYDNENDNSLVLLLIIQDFKILFMGDASIEIEKDIIENYSLDNISVLKVGHHGSKTSTCEEFLNETSPEYAVISAGRNNKYGFPNSRVINLLKKYKTNIVSTINENTIVFRISNHLKLIY